MARCGRQASGALAASGAVAEPSGGGAAPGAAGRGSGGAGVGASAAPGGGARTGGGTNANHLLNFQYESARGAGGRKYDKNKFLQANFRFLVSDAVDVSAYEADADKMFDWDDVLQVEMASAAPIQCPISLDSPPLCPQITPCGHIFSFPAIMHHLVNHGGDQLRRSAPCPLCFAPVVARELRLVRIRRAATLRAGQALTLALIRRNRTSIIPQPVDAEAAAAATAAAAAEAAEAAAAAGEGGLWPSGGGGGGGSVGPPSLFDANPFAKFVVGGSAGELWRAAAQQLAECAMQLVSEGGSDAAFEAPYVYGALEQLAVRARRWAEHRGEVLAARGLLAAREGPAADPAALGAAAEEAVKQMFTAAVSEVGAAAAQRAARDPKAAAAPPSPGTAQHGARSGGPSGAAIGSAPSASTGEAASGAAGSIAAAALPTIAAAAAPAAAEPGAGGSATAAFTGAEPAEAAAAASKASPAFDAIFAMDEQEELTAGSTTGTDEPPAAVTDGPNGRRRSSGGGGGVAAALGDLPQLSTSAGGAALGSAGLLGSSPGSSALNTPGVAGEFYTYQAADGSWLFLHPLSLRCLLSHYGSYDACPPVITARLLELEDVVQADAVRRRWRFLSHLPLGGAFKLCELAMAELLPPEALAPFADELAAREKRRRRQRADDRRQAAAEAAAAARAAAARLGPSAEELQAMPALGDTAAARGGGGGGGLVAAAGAAAAALAREVALSPSEVAESIALQASLEDAAAAAAAGGTSGGAAGGGGSGVSFARITKLGFAATGPALGSSPPLGTTVPAGAWGSRPAGAAAAAPSGPTPSSPWGGGGLGVPAAVVPSPVAGGAWGSGKGSATVKAAAAAVAAAAALAAKAAEQEAVSGGGKKAKSGKGTLLFAVGQQRKY
ncbi:hypothetical protein GPECTOR_92g589 [Gonium pectorale]|uniref:RING-type domain-containing protein n=1 Tax=Gonium pectorale TaxID=33097 RepID=A0A150G0G4_GONPE|nr:hypothetical protein GPECTOR_92g589 [Gonium pectorale]|eukprot:KXZ43366.1 hypothetical protein GPECTOR_92g589 [Gonium pectorale]